MQGGDEGVRVRAGFVEQPFDIDLRDFGARMLWSQVGWWLDDWVLEGSMGVLAFVVDDFADGVE